MKTTFDKKFDAVKYMREQREKLSEKLSKMTKEEIVEYFKRKKFESSVRPNSQTDELSPLSGDNTLYRTQIILFRSGNADGADHYFSLGVTSVDSSRLQVITPYTGHRKKTKQAYETIPLDEINLAEEPEIVYQAKQNKKTEKLIDQYVSGDRDRFALKAAYILRDTIKAIGSKEIAPATFGIFYDDLDDPKTGGTGHTMKICEQNGIDVIDQRTWFKWL